LATEAVIVVVCPGFNAGTEAGDNVMLRELLPEQPTKRTAQTRIPSATNDTALNFLKVSPTESFNNIFSKQQAARMRREPADRSSG
jgi:hypothetical protein